MDLYWDCPFEKPTEFCGILDRVSIPEVPESLDSSCPIFYDIVKIDYEKARHSDDFYDILNQSKEKYVKELKNRNEGIGESTVEAIKDDFDTYSSLYEDFDQALRSLNDVCKSKSVYRIMNVNKEEFTKELIEDFESGYVPKLGKYWSIYPYVAQVSILIANPVLFEAEINLKTLDIDASLINMIDFPSESEIDFDPEIKEDFVLVSIDDKPIIIDGRKTKIPIEF